MWSGAVVAWTGVPNSTAALGLDVFLLADPAGGDGCRLGSSRDAAHALSGTMRARLVIAATADGARYRAVSSENAPVYGCRS